MVTYVWGSIFISTRILSPFTEISTTSAAQTCSRPSASCQRTRSFPVIGCRLCRLRSACREEFGIPIYRREASRSAPPSLPIAGIGASRSPSTVEPIFDQAITFVACISNWPITGSEIARRISDSMATGPGEARPTYFAKVRLGRTGTVCIWFSSMRGGFASS